MKIEVLYVEGCPNLTPAVEQVRQALEAEGIDARIEQVEVSSAAMAQAEGFLGSPSVRIDGEDVEVEARGSGSFGFGCRTYLSAEGRRTGVPAMEMIRQAARERSQA